MRRPVGRRAQTSLAHGSIALVRGPMALVRGPMALVRGSRRRGHDE
jgi:hypothetical protein